MRGHDHAAVRVAERSTGVGANAWVLSREGKVLASAVWAASGSTRVRALQVTGQHEIIMLGDVTPKVDSGMGLDPTHRIDRYDIELKLIDSWSPPAGVRLNGISANASGHLAIVGRRQDRALVQVLEINGWKAGPVRAAPDGEALAAELRDDGELVVVGPTAANLQWLQRYTKDGDPVWPEPKTLPTPPNVYGWSGAVAVQSNGHILATVTQQLGYCD